jgi:hypothetical protein
MTPKPYDTTVAMIAGHILGSVIARQYISDSDTEVVAACVRLARRIVAEVQRTEPEKASE